ncbi:MAG: hypothetical protein R3C16_11795 [Hyphomonadaceae bacterium]
MRKTREIHTVHAMQNTIEYFRDGEFIGGATLRGGLARAIKAAQRGMVNRGADESHIINEDGSIRWRATQALEAANDAEESESADQRQKA